MTINDGRPVRMTICAFNNPASAAAISVKPMATMTGKLKVTTQAPNTNPAKATIEPTDRSNSPPIISIAAPMAKMPSCAAGDMKFIKPASENMALSAVKRKNTVTKTTPATAPSSGRFSRRASNVSWRMRSSSSTTGAAA